MSCLYFISVAGCTNNRFFVRHTIIINYENSFQSIKDDVVVVFDESKIMEVDEFRSKPFVYKSKLDQSAFLNCEFEDICTYEYEREIWDKMIK